MPDNENHADTTDTGDKATPTEPQAPPGAAEEQSTKTEMTVDDYRSALKSANAEAAKYRTERNSYRADAEKYREIQEAEKTDLQRAQEALAAEQANSQRIQVELARAQALAKHGISEDNADLLGADPEKFETNAKRISELQQAAAKRPAPPSNTPVESMVSGAASTPAKPDHSYPASWPVVGRFAQN